MFVRTPGCPVFLAAIPWRTDRVGDQPDPGGREPAQRGTIALVARRVIGVAAGVLAGVVVALDPLQFAASGRSRPRS
jgi:hypothetical protein